MNKSIYKKIVFSALLTLSSGIALGQYVIKEADIQYQLFNLVKATDLYEQAYKKKPTLHAAERLADCYFRQRDFRQAESWYAIAASMPGTKPSNILGYAETLKSNGKYNEAKVQFINYAAKTPDIKEKQKNQWIQSCDSAKKWMETPVAVDIAGDKSLNSPGSDWGTVMNGKSIVFTSDRAHSDLSATGHRPFLKFDGAKKPDRTFYGWTGNQYLNLYQRVGNDSVSLFPIPSITSYHIGPAIFASEREIYFAATLINKELNFARNKELKGKLATAHIGIYHSEMDAQGKWSKPVPFQYNDLNNYSVSDPFITADGQSLYFVSDMPGGLGGTDIYLAKKNKNGEWDKPVNLQSVNTEGNERSPMWDMENNFFFSSDGWTGMGGLDIFTAKAISGEMFTPKNMGYPINTPEDDFAYYPVSQSQGYLSSNRSGGAGSDDIYTWTMKKTDRLWLVGTIFNKRNRVPIAGGLVTLSKEGLTPLKVQTDENGAFKFSIDPSSDYLLTGEKTDFRADIAKISTQSISEGRIEKNLYLEPVELNKEIRIENIYYDFDKSDIRSDAAIELDKLVKVLNDNPTIWIELGSHTDSRGDDRYNQWLSQRRANAAVQYIIEKGISKNRISAKGYGETRLLNRCTNGIKCSAADHQLNRRTEFKIVKY